MKKLLLLLSVSLVILTSCKNEKDDGPHFVTDANFLRICLELYDLNGDGKFTADEAARITELILNNERIYSLDGIEYFTALEYFDCTENFISDIDMSASPKLRVLNANNNPLKTVNVSDNPLLEELWCTPRDIGVDPIGKQPGQLKSLDVSNNPLLKSLNLNSLGLTEINIGSNPNLKELYISNNALRSLDVSHCSALVELQAASSGIEELKLPLSGVLTRLNIDNNNISSLDMAGQTSIVVLGCAGNPLGTIDNIKDCASLYNFGCSDCGLSSLDVSGLEKLRMLYCYDNSLTRLDVTGCESLWWLNCSNNMLTELDLSSNSKLEHLYTDGNSGIQIIRQ